MECEHEDDPIIKEKREKHASSIKLQLAQVITTLAPTNFAFLRKYLSKTQKLEAILNNVVIYTSALFLQPDLFGDIQAEGPQELHPPFAYFQRQWLHNTNPNLWNMFQVRRQTNNDVEGWHLRFNNLLNKHHPNLYELIKALKVEQANTEVQIQQIDARQSTVTRNRIYVTIDNRLQNLENRFNNETYHYRSQNDVYFLIGLIERYSTQFFTSFDDTDRTFVSPNGLGIISVCGCFEATVAQKIVRVRADRIGVQGGDPGAG
uniref:Uncharacterized protein n=1 Tax=Romanomermis culicivorax TaxID=13658 RepID=A0A915KW69_ROMCU